MHDARFEVLAERADAAVAALLDELVANGDDAAVSRINAVAFAEDHGFALDRVIDTFVHASKLALFDLAWNLLCPGCGGVLDSYVSIRSLKKESYQCTLCSAAYQPTLDEMVEVTFSVSPPVRRTRMQSPETLPLVEYYRHVYFSNRLVLPDGGEWQKLWSEFALESEEVPPQGKIIFSIQLPSEFIILFEPVIHAATFIETTGEPVRERRDLSIVYSEAGVSVAKTSMAPGPLRLSIENRSNRRILPGLFVASGTFHQLFENRRELLTAKRLFTNQTFRDLYRTDTLDVDQRLRISNLTVLFTDLKGSTELYDRVGDLAAYDLVRAHFRVLTEVVREKSGAVVKTIGDAVMATFPAPDLALAAALEMRAAIDELNARRGSDDLLVKIGIHEGPCLAVISNERLDYFGQTVNIAARVQSLAESRPIFVTECVVRNDGVRELLDSSNVAPVPRNAMLRGIADEMTVYEIP